MANKSAEILCIGTEILMGNIVNTNATYIARGLANLGINVYHQSVVGDNPERLRDSLRLAFSRADIVITTGGLGPTYDDLSKETIAGYFGRQLVLDPESLEKIEGYFRRSGRQMTENNKKQAYMPKDCTIFENKNGTAPGCAIEQDGKIAILLPGPPREMGPMFEHCVLPYLSRFQDTVLVSRNLHFFGIGESALEARLYGLMTGSTNPTVAPYAKTGEVMLRVTASVRREEDAPALIEPVIGQIKELAGEYLYGIDVGDLQTAAVRALMQKGLHAATAESCTGGLVSKRLTEVDGASRVFECGVCSYSCEMKEQLLGVRHETLAHFGAVSRECAREMAAGVRRLSGADIGVAVTGNAGPKASEEKPVGLVYVAVDSGRCREVLELQISREDDDAREYIRTIASSHALHLLLKAANEY
ncbi:competence/damage-inducible protein A [Harryflintia acetispora]|uniref:Putative competence-damage inducible protein n=1 Tax=Harryflintia acetispora TaxID=1849041 RepID=A0A9X8UKM4_9FIRM|nr:competence/damage-inducible protein A [Harryflintia acetispora]TCL44570.1 nicotinamide-nucleotide amidase [Harryflintia acetispora]